MKINSLRLVGVTLALLSLAALAPAQDIPAQLKGKLVALRGKSALPYDSPDLPQAKYIALYFSAGWCGPCHKFTPDLVQFYNELKPKHPEFEIVFMSRDTGANAMEKYMAEMAMPWPAVRYSAAKNDRALTKYAGSGIPCLVLLDAKGTVLSDSYVNKEYVGPTKVMRDLKKILTGDASGIASSDFGAPASLTAAEAKPETPAIKSPSGTNWDEAFKKKSP
ncbi:MAG: thioredoxin-like domain-containing protein [Spartobacteria bacterium]